MVRAMRRWPLARAGEGLAASFAGLPPLYEKRALLSAALLSLAAGALPLLGEGEAAWPLVLAAVLLLPGAAWLCGTLAARRVSSRLGGLTGDVYGALNELLEAALLLVLVLLQRNIM